MDSMNVIAEFENKKSNAHFIISQSLNSHWNKEGSYLNFIWNDGGKSVSVHVDDQEIELKPNQILCTTYLRKVDIDNSAEGLKMLFFNREFYCVHTYDSEVSCNGLLFFGSNMAPVLTLTPDERDRLHILFKVLEEEFTVKDANQEEMLRILLKRFIIRCTRLAKEQILKSSDKQSDIDIVRQFNVLVEEHFKTRKSVGEYADLMHKSPKTITNVFGKYSNDTPLQVIHKRVIMEAKRLLHYTDKSSKEIGYELGYSDSAQFSKLFKNVSGKTTTQFKEARNSLPIGKN